MIRLWSCGGFCISCFNMKLHTAKHYDAIKKRGLLMNNGYIKSIYNKGNHSFNGTIVFNLDN